MGGFACQWCVAMAQLAPAWALFIWSVVQCSAAVQLEATNATSKFLYEIPGCHLRMDVLCHEMIAVKLETPFKCGE